MISILLFLRRSGFFLFFSFRRAYFWECSVLSKVVNSVRPLSLNAFRLVFQEPYNMPRRQDSVILISIVVKEKLRMSWGAMPKQQGNISGYLLMGIITLSYSFSAFWFSYRSCALIRNMDNHASAIKVMIL